MRRHLLLIPAFASLLLFLAILVLWHRSHRGPDVLKYTSPTQWYLGLISGHGTLDLLYIHHWPQDPELRITRYDPYVYYGTRYSNRYLGFGAGLQPNGGRFVNLPHYFLAASNLALTLLFLRLWYQRRPSRQGYCPRCGYDLRATPDRCPECGAMAVPAPRAHSSPQAESKSSL